MVEDKYLFVATLMLDVGSSEVRPRRPNPELGLGYASV
jgi:hypothetical protein